MKAFTVTTVTTLLYQQLVLSVLFHLVDNQSSVVNAEHLRPEKDNDSSGRKLSGLGIIKNSIKDIEVLESEERNIEETLKQKLSESGELEDLKGDLYQGIDVIVVWTVIMESEYNWLGLTVHGMTWLKNS